MYQWPPASFLQSLYSVQSHDVSPLAAYLCQNYINLFGLYICFINKLPYTKQILDQRKNEIVYALDFSL